MQPAVAARPTVAIVVLLAAGNWLAGCSGARPPEEPGPVDVYVVRGEVVKLPEPGPPAAGLYVRHEAIDDFRGSDGTVWGMDAMTMPFHLAESLSLDGVEVGDKVEMVFEVDWNARPSSRVTEIRELPPETNLEFREARPETE